MLARSKDGVRPEENIRDEEWLRIAQPMAYRGADGILVAL
jgi:hypothetical protein